MSRVAYVNGRYVPHRAAAVHVEDRGFQFADGVYEVIGVTGGRRFDDDLHLDRLERSMREIRVAPPVSRAALKSIMDEVQRRNGLSRGTVYVQVTRGSARRGHGFPKSARPSLVVTAQRSNFPDPKLLERGVAVITMPDIRWKRADIKSVSLLPNVLAKQRAIDAGAFEAWLVGADGHVTEGASTNAWIVTGGALVTHPADEAILDGVTRRVILGCAASHGLGVEQRAFTVDEAKAAAEAFLTSTTSIVVPVVRIDGAAVGGGSPGPFTRELAAALGRRLAEIGR